MVTDDELLDFLIKLESLKIVIEDSGDEWHCVNFNYTHKADIIQIVHDWSNPEEGGYYEYNIDLNTLTYSYREEVSLVFGPSYETNIFKIKNLDEFITNQFKNQLKE